MIPDYHCPTARFLYHQLESALNDTLRSYCWAAQGTGNRTLDPRHLDSGFIHSKYSSRESRQAGGFLLCSWSCDNIYFVLENCDIICSVLKFVSSCFYDVIPSRYEV